MKKKFFTKKRVVIMSIILVLALVIGLVAFFVTYKPGYKEVWEDVEPYHMTWNEATADKDAELIRERMIADVLAVETSKITKSIEKENEEKGITTTVTREQVGAKMAETVKLALEDIKPDGSFSIDYDTDKRNYWYPMDQLKIALKLQLAYAYDACEYYQDPQVKEAAVRAMQYWLKRDFKCDWNGWYNDIGIGQYIPDIILLGLDGMDQKDQDTLLNKITSTLLQNSKVRFKLYERPVGSTGGNLTDQVLSSLKVSVLQKDYNTMMWLKSLLENELRPFPAYQGKKYHRWDAEGPKEDYSFQQHDQLIYFGGYGEVFVDGLTKYLSFTKGTQFELNTPALDFYVNFITEGMQFATRNGFRDLIASGRGIARKGGARGISANIEKTVAQLLDYGERGKLSPPEFEKIQKIQKERFSGETDKGAGGHRYFYMSDYSAYNDENYMVGVRHASKNTRIFEYLNGENPLGYYMGKGSTFYYVDGDEYLDVFPMYNWNKIPGTTTRQGKVPTMNQDFSYSTYGNTKYVSGVSNGKIGMSYFKGNTNAVYARKSYFMFQGGVVCLGADICSVLPNEVVTNINQCLWDGDVIVSQNGKESVVTDGVSGKVDYIHHNKISYLPANEIALTLEKNKEGDWKTINERGDSDIEKKDVFTLDIPHGKWMMGENYAYTVLLNTDAEATKAYAANPTLEVVSNTKKLQAVYDKKANALQAVFHKGGTVSVGDMTLTVNKGCVCIVEQNVDGKYVVTAASLDGENREVKMQLNDKSMTVLLENASSTILF